MNQVTNIKTFTRMKSYKLLLSLILLVFMTSCAIEEDVDPDGNDVRDKFTGTWMFSESPAKKSSSYTVTITNDATNSSQVILRNMANFGSSRSAYGVVTSSRIVIPSQEISAGMTIEGTGTMTSSTRMTWTYTIIGGGDSNDYTAVATK